MPTLLFRHKIVILIITCLCVAQLSTMVATLYATADSVRENVDDELGFAEEIFVEVFEQRYLQLTDSVEVLVNDFGFRAALASQDKPTILSALENHSARADASLAIFIDNQSLDTISTLDVSAWQNSIAWDEKIEKIQREDYLFSLISLNGVYYQIVVVPVMSPAKIGWVTMGFTIDDALTMQFRRLTGLDISIVDIDEANTNDLVSTLSETRENYLIEGLEEFKAELQNSEDYTKSYEIGLGDEVFITRNHLLTASSPSIYAILQQSLDAEMQPYYILKNTLLLIFELVLVFAVFSSLFVGGKIISPIKQLAQVAQRIGQGDYKVKTEIVSSDEFGQLGIALNTMQDEIAEREERIVYQSQHDELTGLPNRYLARDRMSQAIYRAKRYNKKFTIVMLNISGFKKINDTFGYPVGDLVLQKTAQRLVRRERKSDTIARMGGDGFLLIMEESDIISAESIVRRDIQPLLNEMMLINDVKMNIKYNFGLAEFPTHGEDRGVLWRRSELAMFENKKTMERITCYQRGTDESHHRELTIVSDIDRAMKENQLSMHYQPKVNLVTGEINNAEALIRWIHPELGFISPDEFISILEQTGNIDSLSEWIINETFRQCRQWLDKGLDIVISINLSALDLANPELENILHYCLQKYNLDTTSFVLEITESAFVNDADSASKVLNNLRAKGFKVSMDDFGTGYSSLAQLKNLPLDELKIDRAFVMELDEESQDLVIVKSTIDLAHTLHLEVIAEGVEDENAMGLLQACGCNKGQGYFFSKPLPADEFECWQYEKKDSYKGKFHGEISLSNEFIQTLP